MSLKTGSSIKSIFQLVGGAAAGQLILVGTLPIVSRIYQPEDFGVLAVFAAILALLSSVACLRYEAAIPLSRNSDEAINIWSGASILSVVFSVLVFAGGCGYAIYNDFGLSFYFYVLLLSLGVLLAGLNVSLLHYAIFEKKFKLAAEMRIKQAVMAALGRIGIGLVWSGPVGLIIGAILAGGGGVYTLLRGLPIRSNTSNVRKIKMKMFLKENIKLPMYSAPTSLLNAASLQVPVIILSIIFNAKEVGFFALAMRVGTAPLALIGQAVRQVYLANAGEAYRKKNLGKLTENNAISLAAISIIPAFVIAPILPDLTRIVFGNEWLKAGSILALLAPWMVSQLITSPLSSTVIAAGHQKGGLISQGIFLIVRVFAVFLGYLSGDFFKTILYLSISSCLCYLFYSIWVFVISGAKKKRVLLFWMLSSCAGASFYIFAVYLKSILFNANIALFSTAIIAMAVISFALGAVFAKRVISNV